MTYDIMRKANSLVELSSLRMSKGTWALGPTHRMYQEFERASDEILNSELCCVCRGPWLCLPGPLICEAPSATAGCQRGLPDFYLHKNQSLKDAH